MNCILYINPYSNGHHQNYNNSIVYEIISQGQNVCICTSNNNSVKRYLKQKGVEKNASYIDFNLVIKCHTRIHLLDAFIEAFLKWIYIKKIIKELSKKNIQIDLVFIGWLDCFLTPFLHPFIFNKMFKFKWSGIYFHPFHLRRNIRNINLSRDSLLRTKYCKCIFILDWAKVDILHQRVHNKVYFFPDFIPENQNYDSQLFSYIKAKTENKKVVGLIGSLDKRKGIINFLEFINKADNNELSFILAGVIKADTFNKNEYIALSKEIKKIKKCKENCIIIDRELSDEEFNSIIKSINICFVVYEDFPSSSNLITYSAYYKIPVLGSKNYLIGDSIIQFQIGEVVETKNIQEYINKTKFILSNTKKYTVENFNRYSEMHSKLALKKCITLFLN